MAGDEVAGVDDIDAAVAIEELDAPAWNHVVTPTPDEPVPLTTGVALPPPTTPVAAVPPCDGVGEISPTVKRYTERWGNTGGGIYYEVTHMYE